MRVVVTGGAGFIGRWVCDALLRRGDEVVAFDDLSNGSAANVEEFHGSKAFQLIRGDVSKSADVKGGFSGESDACIHLAAVIEVQRSIDDPRRTYEVNVAGTANVLEACRRADARLTIVSTCMVYDAAKGNAAIAEQDPVNPASPYAATKLAADYLGLSYHRAYGLPVTVVRPFNTYGPFQKANQEGGVVAVFLGRALAGKTLQVFGDGEQTRDLMYVDDCVDLIVRASEEKVAGGEVLNGGTGRAVTINELARIVAGPKGKVEHVAHPHPQSEIRKLRCDYGKAAKLLGWGPKVSLEDGITRLRRSMAR